MKISKKILALSVLLLTVTLISSVYAQTASSTLTKAEMKAQANSTRIANLAARQAQTMQKLTADADKQITNRINSLNDSISKIEAIKNISTTNKATIASTTQNEIDSMNALKTKIESDTSTTTLKDDLKSITVDYRVYALIEPQIRILSAADRINQIISLMNTMETKLQARISTLQSSGVDTSSLVSIMSDITTKIADSETQAAAAITKTSSLTPDQGNTATATANSAAIKGAKADIRVGNSDLQTARKDMNNIVSEIRKLVPKGSENTTSSQASSTQTAQ